MNQKQGRKSCLLGFILLAAARWTGSFAWIAQLLGYIGIANGTRAWMREDEFWMQAANRISTAAAAVLAVMQILVLTGVSRQLFELAASLFGIACAVCVLLALFTRKKEENS